MNVDCYDIKGQIFTHVDSKTKINTVFAVTDLRRYCDRIVMRPMMVSIEREDVEMVRHYRGIEKHRVMRALTTKTWLPLMFAHMPDGEHLMIDGSHTFCARYLLGHQWALAYIIPQEIWTYFTVDGLPSATEDQLANSWSGIA